MRLANRTGVNTGEVVAGDPTAGQRLVTGDTVNVAARLEQAAPENDDPDRREHLPPGQRRRHGRGSRPAAAQGQGRACPRVPAASVSRRARPGWPAGSTRPWSAAKPSSTALRDRFAAVAGERRCELVTILGSAGVGKSRLIHELLGTVDGRARVLRGQCLPYGEGITFWALAAAVSQATGQRRRSRRRRPERSSTPSLAPTTPTSPSASPRSRASRSQDFPLQETFWAARRFLEILAARRTVVVVFDDIHWAEPTFLDLIEHLCDTADAPVLLLCGARQELLDQRPEWAAGGTNASRLTLRAAHDHRGRAGGGQPAGHVDSRRRWSRSGSRARQREIPLYVEQTLSMLIEDGVLRCEGGQWELTGDLGSVEIPPTISALITARLDQLGA